MVVRLRIPIKSLVAGRVRVVIYARYSTEEQDKSSIADQFAYCRGFLQANGLVHAEVIELSDEEMSGELVSRPGINQVRQLLEKRAVDLLLCEDTSRLFRHETECRLLVETAVDAKIRVIAINDYVDTAEEDWPDRLALATQHHARANKFTSLRIRRKHDGLWAMNAAIGLLVPGYKRRPTVAESAGVPARGPFFDELDPRWIPVIYECFERVARKDPAWQVAKWLTKKGLPKCANSKNSEWTDRNVIALIRRTVYRGVEEFRNTVCRKEYRTGKHPQERNERAAVLTRVMEHLRIVPDWLWYAANKAIDDRKLCKSPPHGINHPSYRVPRDKRGPLSGLFYCGACGAKMYREGRPGELYRAFYRCGQAAEGRCWNKASAQQMFVHETISKAIVDKLTAADGILDGIVQKVVQLYQDVGPLQALEEELNKKVKEGKAACDRLLAVIEAGTESATPEDLAKRMALRCNELAFHKAKLAQLASQKELAAPLTKDEILNRIAEFSKRLIAFDCQANAALRQLVSPIRAVPFVQFGSNKVVLRAVFSLRLASFLSDHVLGVLQGTSAEPAINGVSDTPLVLDLFERSAGPMHFAEALRLSRDGHTLEAIAVRLGIAKRQAHIAVQYGRELEKAGITDPFIELRDKPEKGSRWVSRQQSIHTS